VAARFVNLTIVPRVKSSVFVVFVVALGSDSESLLGCSLFVVALGSDLVALGSDSESMLGCSLFVVALGSDFVVAPGSDSVVALGSDSEAKWIRYQMDTTPR